MGELLLIHIRAALQGVRQPFGPGGWRSSSSLPWTTPGRSSRGEMVLLHQQWQASMHASGRRSNGEIDTERMNALIADLMRERWGEWFHRVHREYLQPMMYLSWDLVFLLPPNCLLLLVLLCSASARA